MQQSLRDAQLECLVATGRRPYPNLAIEFDMFLNAIHGVTTFDQNSNLKKAMRAAIRINIKLAKVYREQKAEIQELNKKSDIIRFHELENTLEALMNGTDALLAKTASKDAFMQQLEAENNLLFHNNETLFGTISEQRMEVDQLRTENQQLVGENQCLLSTISDQKMLIVQLEQKEYVLMEKLDQAKRGKQKFWNQLQETKEEVEMLTMEVMEERAEAEGLETQLVSELNFSIQQIGVANRLKEKLASVEDENTKTTITLLEKMHQKVQDRELEIEAWNRDQERILEHLEATNKRVIELNTRVDWMCVSDNDNRIRRKNVDLSEMHVNSLLFFMNKY
ncbi:unnamed protein product [Caenorhabditis brenneri]